MIESDNSIIGDYYKDNCLKSLFNSIRRKRSNAGLCGVKLHHDNARPPQTNGIKTFLQEERVMIIRHSSSSSNLARSDFSLFGYLKRQLGSYSDSKSLQQAITKELRAIPQDEFRKTFHK